MLINVLQICAAEIPEFPKAIKTNLIHFFHLKVDCIIIIIVKTLITPYHEPRRFKK